MTTPWIGTDPWIGSEPWAHPDTSAFEGFLDVPNGDGTYTPKPVFKFINNSWTQVPVMFYDAVTGTWVPTYRINMTDFESTDFESAGFA